MFIFQYYFWICQFLSFACGFNWFWSAYSIPPTIIFISRNSGLLVSTKNIYINFNKITISFFPKLVFLKIIVNITKPFWFWRHLEMYSNEEFSTQLLVFLYYIGQGKMEATFWRLFSWCTKHTRSLILSMIGQSWRMLSNLSILHI